MTSKSDRERAIVQARMRGEDPREALARLEAAQAPERPTASNPNPGRPSYATVTVEIPTPLVGMADAAVSKMLAHGAEQFGIVTLGATIIGGAGGVATWTPPDQDAVPPPPDDAGLPEE